MANITPTISRLPTIGDNVQMAQWLLANGDIGLPAALPGFADRSVQISGTFGAAGSVTIEGSNDGITYATLRDPLGVALVFTAADLKGILEVSQYIRARCTAGDGTTALKVGLCMRGAGAT